MNLRTPLCDQFGIEFPIFAFTHCRDVVAAVSQAGGFGVLGAVGFSPEQLEIELQWIDEHVGDKPYGVDVVIPGKYEGMGEIDPERTGNGVIVCRDGFTATTAGPEEFSSFVEGIDVDTRIVEVDESSLFCEIAVP